MCEDEDDPLVAAYGSHAIMHAVFFKQLSRQEAKLLLSVASDVISSSDRSASWPVTLLLPPLLLLLCWASHRGVAGRTNSSLSGVRELMPGTLGRVWKRFLNWLCGKIRKKKAGKLLILDLYPPRSPHPQQLQVWELTCIKTSETAWRANRNCFLEHL